MPGGNHRTEPLDLETVRYHDGDLPSRAPADARVARYAAARHGVFTYADAIRLGATKRVVHRRLEAGRWERLQPGVYRMSGAPPSWRQMLLAACLGCRAAASHRSAAALERIVGFEAGPIELSVPRGRHPRRPGMTIHQLPLPEVDVMLIDAIPTTTPARTLLDLAATCPVDVVEEALDDALRRGLVTPARLRWRLDELGRRPGAATIRRLLEARSTDAGVPQSVLETRFLRLIRRAGLPEPTLQCRIRDRGRLVAIVDFAYAQQMLAIEVDGYRWHSGRTRWQHDLSRRTELARLGWRVMHITAEDLERHPERTAEIVARSLAAGL